MANEARVFAEGASDSKVRQFTVADGTAIAKGALLVYGSASRTAIVHTASGVHRPLGFAVEEKEASDGKTEMGVQRTGVVEAIADGVVTTGDAVYASAVTANRVQASNPTSFSLYQDQNRLLGRALANAADAARVKIALNLG